MLFSVALSAQDQAPKHGKPGFITACENLSEQAQCNFTKKDVSCEGTCQLKTKKDGKQKMICVSDTEGCKFQGRHK